MSTPFISIVSGTFNRQKYLQNMMLSARAAFPSESIPYEFVIVDGGSDDGTLNWLRQQPHTRVIEDGELLGAISAFTRGAYAAQGDYVLLANDDIAFYPESVSRALVWLEDHPTCGAVAFADNRPLSVAEVNPPHRVKHQGAHYADGEKTTRPYAQVGMFRKWLGDAVGWWGANDECMAEARTYGGDNYLSAMIWEAGYSIDPVDGAQIDDHVPWDDMRIVNQISYPASNDGRIFRRRFPNGHLVNDRLQYANPQQRQLRILYLPIFEPGKWHDIQRRNKRGLREALSRVGLVYEVDYLAVHDPARRLPAIVAAWQPDLMLSQFHGAEPITPDLLKRAREACSHMTVVNWTGDAFRKIDKAYIDLLHHVDLQLVVDATSLRAFTEYGIPTAYWQIGYEEPANDVPEYPARDVVFLGNNYHNQRGTLERMLRSNGWNVGIYGTGWKQAEGNTLYDFAAGEGIYRRTKIAVGDTFPGARAFVSNRFFQALAAGAFLLQQRSPDFEAYNPGLADGQHYVGWNDLNDLERLIHWWLADERGGERQHIAEAGRAAVLERYGFDAQVRKLFADIMPEVLA